MKLFKIIINYNNGYGVLEMTLVNIKPCRVYVYMIYWLIVSNYHPNDPHNAFKSEFRHYLETNIHARSLLFFLKNKCQIKDKCDRKRRQTGFKSGNNVYLKSHNGSRSEPMPTHTNENIPLNVNEEHLFTED